VPPRRAARLPRHALALRCVYRSRTDRKLAGVCGGLARYFNTDATLIRVLFVVLGLLGGPGIVIYGVLWLVLPIQPEAAG
jgi:phage shock protein C